MNLKPSLLASELSLFLIVQLIGLWVGRRLLVIAPAPKMETGPSIIWFLGAFVLATVLILLAIKFLKTRIPFSLLFAFLIFVGANIVFSTFLPPIWALALAVLVAGARLFWPNILTQNFGLILAVAGVGAQLGVLLTVQAVILLLIALSIYDVWAVFKTKHMIYLARGLIKRGMPPMIVIPTKPSEFFKGMEEVRAEKLKLGKRARFMMLGTGDLAFPLVFAVSALQYGIQSALAVIIGALIGMVAVHLILANTKIRAIPALPPIATGAIIAFAVSILKF